MLVTPKGEPSGAAKRIWESGDLLIRMCSFQIENRQRLLACAWFMSPETSLLSLLRYILLDTTFCNGFDEKGGWTMNVAIFNESKGDLRITSLQL